MSVNYRVPGIIDVLAQPSGMACWATVGTMMMSWRDQKCRTIESAMSIAGEKWRKMFTSGKGLVASDHGSFARAIGTRYEQLMCFPATTWEQMLRDHGPLAVVTANPFHARIMMGIRGDGSAAGTSVNLVDPAGGRRYDLNFGRFTRDFEAVARSPRFQLWHY